MSGETNSSQIEIYWSSRRSWMLLGFVFGCPAILFFCFHVWSIKLAVILAVLLLFLPKFIMLNFDKRPCIIINDEGFFDRRLKTGVIPWSDIKELVVTNVEGTKCIGFKFYDDHKYRYCTSWLTRLCAFFVRMPKMNTTARLLEINFEDLYRLIFERHERFKTR